MFICIQGNLEEVWTSKENEQVLKFSREHCSGLLTHTHTHRDREREELTRLKVLKKTGHKTAFYLYVWFLNGYH